MRWWDNGKGRNIKVRKQRGGNSKDRLQQKLQCESRLPTLNLKSCINKVPMIFIQTTISLQSHRLKSTFQQNPSPPEHLSIYFQLIKLPLNLKIPHMKFPIIQFPIHISSNQYSRQQTISVYQSISDLRNLNWFVQFQFQFEDIYFLILTNMSLFRSAEMKYFHMHIPKQDTYEVVNRIAQYDFVQFIDAAPNNFHKPFFNSVKRCEQVIQKIDIILGDIKKQKIHLPQPPLVEDVFQKQQLYMKTNKISSLSLLDKIEEQVQSKFATLDKLTKSIVQFQEKIIEMEDYKYLLFKAREIFSGAKRDDKEIDLDKNSFNQLRLVNISGIIEAKDLMKFTKMVFRASKGNSILYTFNIPSESDTDNIPRSAFIAIIESGSVLINKLTRICESFNAKKYRLPTNKDQVFDKIKQIEDNITDTKQLWVMAEKNLNENLQFAIQTTDFGCARFQAFRVLFEKQSLIFNTMNLLQETYNIMVGKIWVEKQKTGLLYQILPSFVSLRQMQPDTKYPTHIQTNTFTAPFQQIVNTYGIPRYQQVNPALYAIPIFPFLFGVMFGDIGHGGAVLAFSIWMLRSDSAKKIIPDIYKIRYLLFMMGMCSFYAGWIYNEFFAMPINVFGSCYESAEIEEYAAKEHGCVYPFGFDPKWFRSSNQLNYFNSFKMKFAVIIGVVQMTFAIMLKMVNSLHFKNYIDFFCEWLPQQIFFFSTFGYMCILIIYKWTIAWGFERDTSLAPSIIGQMIALPLAMGSTEGKPLWDMQSQQALQYNLLMIALICVPWMLIPKPLILFIQSQSQPQHKHHEKVQEDNLIESLRISNDQAFDSQQMMEKKKGKVAVRESVKPAAHSGAHDAHQDISEIAVHQIIETIQFVLGSISNTASYLRLWALSLAHGQLSKVFFEKTIGGGIQSANAIVIVIGMFLFFNITLAVIMGMDTMQCFLHALRLQWVEFQNKFFKADGWKFSPLTLVAPIQAKADAVRQVQ